MLLVFANEAERKQTEKRLVKEALEWLAKDTSLVESGAQRKGSEPPRKRLRKSEERPGMQRLLGRAAQLAPAAQQETENFRESVKKAVTEWLQTPQVPPESDPLLWWADAVAKLPQSAAVRYLAPLARKYLCVPGANRSIERVWSSGRRTLVFNRQSLSGKHVDMLLTMKHNMEALGMWPPKPLPL